MPARGQKVQLTCAFCLGKYQRNPSAAAQSKYCSRLCHNRAKGAARAGTSLIARMRGRMIDCPGCGAPRYVRPCEEQNGGRKYCSATCYRNDPNKRTNKGREWDCAVRARMSAGSKRRPSRRRPNAIKRCLNCGHDFQQGAGRYGREVRRFCSAYCWYDWLRGKPWECARYIDGASTERQSRGPNWARQRRAAVLRDNGACRECGATNQRLHVHHVVPWRAFAGDYISANDLGNLLSLCNRCHVRLERYTENLFGLIWRFLSHR